ncbi:carbohydrate ABC transporter permease [Radiobacillus sp. PE A8.2]|uniref:carbohydrate ABC transporter permease n=1 Tax=Radiobacillus sp. PE A8.2 TaxID=3380349 RepID=UPI00388FDE11
MKNDVEVSKGDGLAYKLNNRKGLTEKTKDKFFLISILLPAALLLCFTIGIPIVKSLYMSFFDVKLLSMNDYTWNQFANYKKVITDPEFFHSTYITFKYVIIVVLLQFAFGLLLALILNSNIRFRRFLRTVVLLPWIVPTIVTALLWMWLFQPQYGLINYVLQSLNIINEPNQWLQSIDLALPAIIVTALWRQLPFMSTMLLAGLQGIPEQLYEAAKIDGASKLQLFWHVTLPMLKGTIKTVSLIAIIENFKMFPLFWIMTGGGPLDSTTTLAILSYETAFTDLDLGLGATIGAIWLVIMLVVAWLYNMMFKLGSNKV